MVLCYVQRRQRPRISLSSPLMSTRLKGATLSAVAFPLLISGAFFGAPVFVPAALLSSVLGSVLMIKGECFE
nr:hypothetical protein [uncultured Mediterranean phage uvMED]